MVKKASRFEAREPIRQGMKQYFGGFDSGIATGLRLRHDHGSVYMSDDFQSEIRFLGIESSPAFVRQPEGKAYASYCTSCEPQTTFSGKRRRLASLTPWALRGGLGPGCSYSQSSRSFNG